MIVKLQRWIGVVKSVSVQGLNEAESIGRRRFLCLRLATGRKDGKR